MAVRAVCEGLAFPEGGEKMIEGLWSMVFVTNKGSFGGGVVVFDTLGSSAAMLLIVMWEITNWGPAAI